MSTMPTAWKPALGNELGGGVEQLLVTASTARRSAVVLGRRHQYDFGQAERLLRDEVQDHLAAHRRDAQQPEQAPEVGEAVLRRHAVAAVGLDRGVETVQPGFGRRVLRHVRGLAGGGRIGVVVVEPRGLRDHQARQLELDLGGGERVRDALVLPDRHVPHRALARVLRRAVERVATEPGADRGAGDALGVQAREHLAQTFVLVAEQPVARNLHVVEEELELLLGRGDLDGDQRAFEPGLSGSTMNIERRASPVVLVGAGAGDDEDARRPRRPPRCRSSCRAGGRRRRRAPRWWRGGGCWIRRRAR